MKDKLVWNIGGVEIFAIQEIVDAGELIQSIIPEASKEEVGKIDWLVPNFASETGELKAVVQCFLIKTDNQSILVDTCNGNDKTRTDMPIWGNLETDFLEKLESVTGCSGKYSFTF